MMCDHTEKKKINHQHFSPAYRKLCCNAKVTSLKYENYVFTKKTKL